MFSFIQKLGDLSFLEELQTQLHVFHEQMDEDIWDFSQRYDNVKIELTYPFIEIQIVLKFKKNSDIFLFLQIFRIQSKIIWLK